MERNTQMSAQISVETPEIPVDASTVFRNRIVRFDPAVDPNDLAPNPRNPRLHPEQQKAAMRGILSEVGWVGCAIYNLRTQRLIDGHERREEAISASQTMPVLYVDLDLEEEKLVLASFDPLASMANYDNTKLDELLSQVSTGSEAIAQMLADMQIEVKPTYENTGQTGDRQIERATIARIAVQVADIRTIERALVQTGVEDRGQALLALSRYYLQSKGFEDGV